MSRFGGPYDNESVLPALLELFELFECLFGVNRFKGFDCYASDVVMFQSFTIRWRHFYNTTFDFSYLMVWVDTTASEQPF